MSKENNPPKWGAKIERGRVTGVDDGLYTVESIDRPGVTGYGLPCFWGSVSQNEVVYFFLFPDGTGGLWSTTGAETDSEQEE